LCLLSTSGSEYNFNDHITTSDSTPTEFIELDSLIDELIEQIPIIEGITLSNSDDVLRQFDKEAQQQYQEIMKQEGTEKYNPALDPEIEHKTNSGQMKKRISGKRFDKDEVKRLVSQADLFGLSRKESCAFINKALNPDGDPTIPEFTPTMYATWLNKLKEHKIIFFDYYSRTGIYEDVYDTRLTVKMVYQNLARQFRMEIMKGKEKDKTYIIKLAETIDQMSDTMMRVSMSSPFIAGFKSLMDYKNGIIDEIKRKYPNVLANLDIKPIGSQLSLPAEVRSSPDGESRDEEGPDKGTILERFTAQEEGAGDGEGDIQEPTISRGIQESNGTTRNRLTERVFG
jgi:hypothetical protein